MARLLLAAASVAAAVGLLVHDGPSHAPSDDTRASSLRRAGDATVLDPELTNADLEKFHVTQPGEHAMIVLPDNADLENPAGADVIVYATFEKLTTEPCEDLLIRSITIEGSTVGTNVTKLVFFVGNDFFNDTRAPKYTYTMVRDDRTQDITNSDPLHLYENVPQCRMSVPRGYLKAPTYRTFLKRSRFMEVECSLAYGTHEVKVFWNTVWRGEESDGTPVYANDLSFSISNVAGAGGILGHDDHSSVSAAIQGCNKKQPVKGPYQTRRKTKEPKWKRAHHFR